MHQWTNWHKNPFAAVAEAANSNGTPEDIEKAKNFAGRSYRVAGGVAA